MLISLWLLSPLLLWDNIVVRLFTAFCMAITTMANIISAGTALLYHVCAAETFWEVLAASSLPEIKEFLLELSPLALFLAGGALLVGPLSCFVLVIIISGKLLTHQQQRPFLRRIVRIPFLLCVLPFTCIIIFYIASSNHERIFKKSLLFRYYYEFTVFQKRIGTLAEIKNLPVPYEDVKFNDASSNLLGVIVIGESASRNHLGCYGYARNTTPYFSEIKKELLLFDNVLSSSPVTPDALKYLFTNACLRDKEFAPRATLLQVLAHLGAETYYVSNQGRWGSYNMPCTLMFNQATGKSILSASVLGQKVFQYDEVILKDFSRFLNLQPKKRPRFIFLHLIGSHRKFDARVPKNEVLFQPDYRDHLSYGKKESGANHELNYYDSSIAYTDKILKQIVLSLKSQKDQPSFLLYFSDHGEVLNAQGRNKRSYKCTRREAYEIPFIVWTNEQYRKSFPETVENGKKNLHKLVQTDRLFPSLFSLMQISWKNFPYEQDIFSEKFVAIKDVYSIQGKSTRFTDKEGKSVIFQEVRN